MTHKNSGENMAELFLETVYGIWKKKVAPIGVIDNRTTGDIIDVLSDFYEFLFGEKTIPLKDAKKDCLAVYRVPNAAYHSANLLLSIRRILEVQRHRSMNSVIVCQWPLLHDIESNSMGIDTMSAESNDGDTLIVRGINSHRNCYSYPISLNKIKKALEKSKDASHIAECVIKNDRVFNFQIDNTFTVKNGAFITDSIRSAGVAIPRMLDQIITRTVQVGEEKIIL